MSARQTDWPASPTPDQHMRALNYKQKLFASFPPTGAQHRWSPSVLSIITQHCRLELCCSAGLPSVAESVLEVVITIICRRHAIFTQTHYNTPPVVGFECQASALLCIGRAFNGMQWQHRHSLWTVPYIKFKLCCQRVKDLGMVFELLFCEFTNVLNIIWICVEIHWFHTTFTRLWLSSGPSLSVEPIGKLVKGLYHKLVVMRNI